VAGAGQSAVYEWLGKRATVLYSSTLTIASGEREKEGAMDDPSETVLSWFEDHELSDCPACGEKKVVPAQAGEAMLVCAACGIVTKPTSD
jgi:hypothetical protein